MDEHLRRILNVEGFRKGLIEVGRDLRGNDV